MPYGVLGPTLAGRSPATGGVRLRALLARLLLDAGRAVSLDRLIDDVYGDDPPAGAVNAVQSNVSRLRRELPISYDGAGYRLDVPPDEVDALRFARLAADGRAALHASDFATACAKLSEALSLWRGEALADVRSAPFAAAAADRLEQARRQAVEDRIEAELGPGGHSPAGPGVSRSTADAVSELRELTAVAPLRERAWLLMMRALVAGGRPAEALAAFEEARRVLADQIGADPSPELAEMHAAILRGGPAPRQHTPDPPPPPRTPRLPAQLSSFIGRGDELARIAAALRTARLVTLLGPGGAGKTRLSLEAAARSTSTETFLVELAATGPADVPRAVFDALGLRDTSLLARTPPPAPPGTTPPGTVTPDTTPPGTVTPDTTPPGTVTPDTTPPGAVTISAATPGTITAGAATSGESATSAATTGPAAGGAAALGATAAGPVGPGASAERRGDGPDTVERLLAALDNRDVLLVLDNCEHVVEAAAVLAGRLLAGCAKLRVLATSREPLGVTGEVRVAVAGLPLDAGVRLFADRAAEVGAGFTLDARTEPDVHGIVRTLDGLPLALELAAARLPVMAVDELARRMVDRFGLLSRGSRTADERHRTLRAVVAWSWDLLTEPERRLAGRFTVFRGSADLDAIEQICGPQTSRPQTSGPQTSGPQTSGPQSTGILDVLDGLVAKSLIERDGSRYRMLSTIRAFCTEQVTDRDAVVERHAAYFLALARTADAHLRGPGQLVWLDRLDADRDNLHAAVRDGSAEQGLQLVSALSFYWWLRGARGEASALARELLVRVGPVAPEGLTEEYVLCALNAGLAGPMVAGEHPAHYLAGLDRPPAQPFLLYLSAIAAGPPAELQDQLLDMQDALTARLRDSPWSEALSGIGGGWLALFRGQVDRATAEFEKALTAFQGLGERWGMMLAQSGRAEMAVARGDHAAARGPMDEALRLAGELGSQVDLADLLRSRGEARMLSGDNSGAADDFARAMTCAATCGAPELVAAARLGQGRLALRAGDPETAREHCRAALAGCPADWYAAAGIRVTILLELGRVAEAAGDPDEAARWYRQVTPGVPGPDVDRAFDEARKALAAMEMR
ncbi:winged helix-turn-helix domain-containing protein [Actinoplanes bogorensis]|uniref:Winged helix-turn-helix domain-containing protein n=1 Tax=Paractinoplanes bogorensis TaxID=1610840 RepID=A0ABS5YZU3_9ACTN|nr:BTAD domain-containing putative transcriptional regulator [Actinoplanes bogorensis]MBU2668964.1 winged helix-turn-helix domain-containing protein [Actinoplanes bogorensis]